MKKKFLFFSLSFLLLNNLFSQTKISGVTLPPRLGFNETIRTFAGAGTREKYFMRIYVLGLYMQEPSKDANVIVDSDQPMSIRLQIISSMLTSDVMVKYIREGFSRSLEGKVEPYAEFIDLICNVFSSEPTKVGDVYDIHYSPTKGISASKNNKPYAFESLSKTAKANVAKSNTLTTELHHLNYTKSGQAAIPGLGFKKALFGIWFSKDPVDEKLKSQVIAKK